MTIKEGTKLGRYEISSQLGAGGMGVVYLAQDTKLNRRVAIKFLPIDSIVSEEANKRLLREARVAATLDHPNICAVHEVGEEDGRSFIVMQYVEGETLDLKLKQNPPDLHESLSISTQIADALAEAHARGIIHRDIKPSNIIITPRGQSKVMDFGLAKGLVERVDSEAQTHSLLTTPGAIVGTVPYMSPEQLRGEKIGVCSDIFSFGVVLYEILTRHPPFGAERGVPTISAILTKEPPPLTSYLAECPEELQRIVSKCLEKDCERRYQSMRDLASDLEVVRRECDGRLPATREKRSASTAAINKIDEPRAAFITPRVGLTLAAVLTVLAGFLIYAVFFRSPPLAPADRKSVNSPAYDYYMRGKVIGGSENREDIESAIALQEQAVKVDPNFAAAWAELAYAYNRKSFFFAPEAENKQLSVEAEVAVEKALALDANLAEGHYARGLILWTYDKRFPHEQAIQSFKRALALNPNLTEAHHRLGVVYLHIGLLDRARAELEKALEAKPSNTIARLHLGIANEYEGNYEVALATFKSIPRATNPILYDRNMAETLIELGRLEEASAIVDDYLKYETDEGGSVTSVKAMLLAEAGKQDEAEEAIQRAIKIGKNFGHFHHTAYNIGVAYALLNKPTEAIEWLQVSAETGFPCYPWFANHARLNSLRTDERFRAFLAKVKQQWENYKATM